MINSTFLQTKNNNMNLSTTNKKNEAAFLNLTPNVSNVFLKAVSALVFVLGIAGNVLAQCTNTNTIMLPTTIQNPGVTFTTNTAIIPFLLSSF